MTSVRVSTVVIPLTPQNNPGSTVFRDRFCRSPRRNGGAQGQDTAVFVDMNTPRDIYENLATDPTHEVPHQRAVYVSDHTIQNGKCRIVGYAVESSTICTTQDESATFPRVIWENRAQTLADVNYPFIRCFLSVRFHQRPRKGSEIIGANREKTGHETILCIIPLGGVCARGI